MIWSLLKRIIVTGGFSIRYSICGFQDRRSLEFNTFKDKGSYHNNIGIKYGWHLWRLPILLPLLPFLTHYYLPSLGKWACHHILAGIDSPSRTMGEIGGQQSLCIYCPHWCEQFVALSRSGSRTHCCLWDKCRIPRWMGKQWWPPDRSWTACYRRHHHRNRTEWERYLK